jgi:hypothetical protein
MRCRDCEDVITDEPITLHAKCFHDLHDSRDTLLALVVVAKQKAERMLAAIVQRFPEEEEHRLSHIEELVLRPVRPWVLVKRIFPTQGRVHSPPE